MAFLTSIATKRCCTWLILSVCLLAPGAATAAQAGPTKEYQVKAVFLYRFAEFVEWPAGAFAGPSSPLVIGLLGSDPFGSYLDDTVRGERIDGRSFVIRRCKRDEDIPGCNVLFVSHSESNRLSQIFAITRSRSILTIGDLDDFGTKGGMIQFVIEDGKTRLLINNDAAKAAHLTISSKLLRKAQIVSGGQ
jgi:hypothetical protein